MGQKCCGVEHADTSKKGRPKPAPLDDFGSSPSAKSRSAPTTSACDNKSNKAADKGPAKPVAKAKPQEEEEDEEDFTLEDVLDDALEAAYEDKKKIGRSNSFGAQSDVSDAVSVGGESKASSAAFMDGLSKEERKQAKTAMKLFVKEMVKGKEMTVVLKSGQAKPCHCSLSRQLDTMKVKASKSSKKAQTVILNQIKEIVVGTDIQFASCDDLETPLDDMCVTLVVSKVCMTFRMTDETAQDIFVRSFEMFTIEAGGAVRVHRGFGG